MSDTHEALLSIGSRLREWVLLEGNRGHVAAIVPAITFALMAWMEANAIVDVERDTVALLYLFEAFAAGNFTLVTIVISINQLVLSRELRTPGELESEQEDAVDFRHAVEEETDREVLPGSAENFLVVLVRDTREQLERLGGEIEAVEEGDLRDDLVEFRSSLIDELDRAIGLLEETDVGVFRPLSTILDVNAAVYVNHSRWLRNAHEDALPASAVSCLDDLEARLQKLDVARQYFKTIYVQEELANLSRVVFVAGLLAIGVAVAALASIGYLDAVQPSWEHPLLVPLAVTVDVVPISVLFSHVLRIATVARRTAAISPFVTSRP